VRIVADTHLEWLDIDGLPDAGPNSVKVRVAEATPDTFALPTSGAVLSVGDAVDIGIRAEDLHFATPEAKGIGFVGTTRLVENMGHFPRSGTAT
jgi:hypothetical protein